MNIAALFQQAQPLQAQLRLPQLRIRPQRTLLTSMQNSTTVQISETARSLGNKPVQPNTSSPKAAKLRDFLSKFDFSSITPRQAAQIGGTLCEKGEISESAASAFIGIETNLVQGIDPDKPIDISQHFQLMLNAARGAIPTVPGEFDFAVSFRQEASKTLDDIISFVSDNRSHIST